MNNNSIRPAKTYRDEVMVWGNLSPWQKLGMRVSNKVSFQPDEVLRDGKGNITSMPPLTGKPCFGRPEAFFRHGKRTQARHLPNGRIIQSTRHQCGACPAGVWQACAETAWERVQSDPGIRQAFSDWLNHCKTQYSGVLTYTGPASRPWGAFKVAIAARGPFESSNDKALRELAAQHREDQRRKWVKQKRRQRAEERAAARKAKQLPSDQFIVNLQEERDRREDMLLKVLGKADQPPSRSRVRPEKRHATAKITANAWAVRKLMEECGRKSGPGRIARLMVDNSLNAGTSYETLKARIANDLKRADECEREGLWQPFDLDRDLDGYEAGDDDAADALGQTATDLEVVLRELDPFGALAVEGDHPLQAPPTNAVQAVVQ